MNDNFDYFEIFGLSKQDSQKANYEKLKKMTTYVEELGGSKGMALQLLHSEAMSTFKDEIKYQAYLKKLDARNSSTDNKAQAELEKERQRAAREAEARRKAEADAEAAKRRVGKAQAEAEAAKGRAEEEAKRRVEAEEAERRALEAQQQAASFAKTSLYKVGGDFLKERLNLASNSFGATAIDLLTDHLNTKQNQASQPSVNQPSTITQQSINLSSIWRDPDGTAFKFRQQGNQLSVRAENLSPLVRGDFTGIVSGREVQLSGFLHVVPYGSHMQMAVTLSEDGLRLEGNSFANGKTFPLILYRQF